MPFLLDTNCWMQLIRKREHATTVAELLREIPASEVVVTDFSVHTVMILMRKFKQLDDFPLFLANSGFGQSVAVMSIPIVSLPLIIDVVKNYQLDIDDGYQYVAADLHNLRLVSLDTDFDRTPRGRLTPAAALQVFREEQPNRQQEA